MVSMGIAQHSELTVLRLLALEGANDGDVKISCSALSSLAPPLVSVR